MYQLLSNSTAVLSSPLFWIFLPFQLWMLVDAIRRREWIWAVFIFFFSVLSAVFYYLMVYRPQGPAWGGGARGFELPGAADRRRIRELQARIHNLDNARDHFDLGDVYFAQGKLAKAEESYRAALQRDPTAQSPNYEIPSSKNCRCQLFLHARHSRTTAGLRHHRDRSAIIGEHSPRQFPIPVRYRCDGHIA